MKIKIVTSARMVYEMSVESRDFDEIVDKIAKSKYVKLNDKTILLTSSITEIQKIS